MSPQATYNVTAPPAAVLVKGELTPVSRVSRFSVYVVTAVTDVFKREVPKEI